MCKLEHYNNCDEETKDQEYCIFHKPNKSEEEAKEFWRKFLERFKPKEDIIIEKGRIFKRLIFESEVNCNGFVFPNYEFPLRRAIFKKFADFTGASFEGIADFSNAHFRWGAEFSFARFNEFADFSHTILSGKTNFDYSIFRRGVSFDKAELYGSEVSFNSVIFENGGSFKEVKFNCFQISFDHAKFCKSKVEYEFIDFTKAGFGIIGDESSGGETYFLNVTFDMPVKFDRASFIGHCDFSDTEFKWLTSFRDTVFKGKIEFEGSEFIGFVDFRGKPEGERYKFYDKLSFESAIFHRGINVDIPSEWFRLPEAEAEACRVQRLCYEKEGKKDKADEMFVREREEL